MKGGFLCRAPRRGVGRRFPGEGGSVYESGLCGARRNRTDGPFHGLEGGQPEQFVDIPARYGAQRRSGGQPLTWTSRYGSVVTSAYDICSTDGMNEAGLVANLLWLAESAYPEWDGSTPGLSIAAWVQYILDTCATVDEAVAEMESGRFEVVSGMMPDRFENGYPAPLRIGCRGRQCHIRICGRGSVRSSQSGIQGDDQLAAVRPAAGSGRLLAEHRRTDLPARNEQGGRPLRAGLLLCGCASADSRYPAGGCRHIQRHTQCLGSARHQRSRPAQYLLHSAGGRCPTRRTGCIISNPRFIPIFSGWI